nr:hypothetical protein [Archangium sp.]
MSEEVRAMLTPESIAAMMSLSAAWLGSQGVPVVGQAVDVALVVFGVTMLAAQAADLKAALWAYVNHAKAARSRAELEAASAHLSRAIALVGVNVVAFILTKKAVGSVKPGPPPPRLVPAPAASRQLVPATGISAQVSTATVPAFAAMGTRPEIHLELPATGTRKIPDRSTSRRGFSRRSGARPGIKGSPPASKPTTPAKKSSSSEAEVRRFGPMVIAPVRPTCWK